MKHNSPGNALLLFLCLLALLIVLTGCAAANPRETGSGIRFSHSSGVYPFGTLTVTIEAPEGYTVAYTTDGRFPTAEDDSGRSTVRVKLKGGMSGYLIEHADLQKLKDFGGQTLCDDPTLPCGVMLCAAPVDASGIAGEPGSEVYFLGMDFQKLFPDCLVLSVVTDPENLLDYDRGILAAGAVYDAWRLSEDGKATIEEKSYWLAESNSTQHGRAWERPCLLQLYDGGSAPVVEQAAGIRTQGGYSRRLPQKSFNLYFRSDYGKNTMDYELFPGICQYKSLVLRAGGNNTSGLKYKNAMLQDLVSDRAVTVESSRPAVLFLNGEYWGPYLLTEKISAQMLHDHYGVRKDQVVVFKDGELEEGEEGDLLLYEELLSCAEQDLTQPEAYRRFCSVVDVESFADYCAVRVYIGDADWNLRHNEVLWRTRDPSYREGRWQFLLHDIGYSSGLHGNFITAPGTNHCEIAITKHSLFAAAMRNEDFRTLFLNALMQIGAENYSCERVMEAMQSCDALWRPLMGDYYRRFGSTIDKYNQEAGRTLDFFARRYDRIVPFVRDR